MKHDITTVLVKHINELKQILDKYNVTDKSSLISTTEKDMVFQKAFSLIFIINFFYRQIHVRPSSYVHAPFPSASFHSAIFYYTQ